MSRLNVTHEHGELKECVLADFYTPDFWDEWIHVDDPTVNNIRDTFKKISEEIKEDFDQMQATLEQHGVTVHRPDTASIEDELISGDMTGQDDNANSSTIMDLIANVDAPMNPGFDVWSYNNTLYTAEEKDIEYATVFAELEQNGATVERDPNNNSLKKFPFQSLQRVGNEIWVDTEEVNDVQVETLRGMLPADIELVLEEDVGQNFVKWIKPNLIHYSGHTEDPGPNKALEIPKIYSHGMTVATWLRDTKNINDMSDFVDRAIGEMLAMNENKWWLDRFIETNDEAIIKEVHAFLEYWATFTMGVTPFCQDGITINSETFMTMGHDPDQASALKEHGVDLVSVPFRHRFLWGHSLRGYIADLNRI